MVNFPLYAFIRFTKLLGLEYKCPFAVNLRFLITLTLTGLTDKEKEQKGY